jgi:hypothetical protein
MSHGRPCPEAGRRNSRTAGNQRPRQDRNSSHTPTGYFRNVMKFATGWAIKRVNPVVMRVSDSGASRTRTGDLLGAIQGAQRLNVAILQGVSGSTQQPTAPKSVRNLREFARVLARGGVRVANPGRLSRTEEIARFLGTTTAIRSSARQCSSHARRERDARSSSMRQPRRGCRRCLGGGVDCDAVMPGRRAASRRSRRCRRGVGRTALGLSALWRVGGCRSSFRRS